MGQIVWGEDEYMQYMFLYYLWYLASGLIDMCSSSGCVLPLVLNLLYFNYHLIIILFRYNVYNV